MTRVYVELGDSVRTGDVLVQLDNADVADKVRDAKTSLESAELALEQLREPATELELMQAQNNLTNAQESKTDAQEDLEEAYEDGFVAVSDAFTDLPTALTELDDVLFGTDFGQNQWNLDYYISVGQTTTLRSRAYDDFKTAEAAYEANAESYRTTSRLASNEEVADLLEETYVTLQLTADAIKSVNNLIQYYQDEQTSNGRQISSISTTHLSTLSSNSSRVNSHISSIFSVRRSIDTAESDIVSAERTIAERTETLAELQSEPDALDIRGKEITIQEKKNALADAYETYADYRIVALFDGIVTDVDALAGEHVTTAQSLVSLTTEQKRVTISLNEVDISNVSVGQEALITFDAVEDLEILGHVSEVDLVGTVTSGVVTYDVEVMFDEDDERIKPGMTALVDTIVAESSNTFVVQNSAITEQDGQSSITVLERGVPQQYTVTLGVCNDTHCEIYTDLAEGTEVVIKTVAASDDTNESDDESNGRSGFGVPGMGGGPPDGGGPRE